MYCSPSCSSKYNNKARTGFRNVQLTCNSCGTIFERLACDNKKHGDRGFNRVFCSKECASIGFRGDDRRKTSKSLVKYYITSTPHKTRRYHGGFRYDLMQYFRSSWEANYARVLNHLNIRWEYEPRAFLLEIDGEDTTYTPDFYLPTEDKWVEIKGRWVSDVSKKKYYEFSSHYKSELIDLPKYICMQKQYQNIVNWEHKKYASNYDYL